MAAPRPKGVGRLAVAAPVGLWRDEAPVVDMFGMMPHELVPYLFHDQSCPAAQLMHATTNLFSEKDDRTQDQVEFLISLVRGFRTAAKFLFPIPENGLEKRLSRITAPTLVVWGTGDRFVQPLYARIFAEKIPRARLEMIEDAGHLIGLERPEPYARAVVRWGDGLRAPLSALPRDPPRAHRRCARGPPPCLQPELLGRGEHPARLRPRSRLRGPRDHGRVALARSARRREPRMGVLPRRARRN